MTKEIEFETWAYVNKIELTPELYLQNQRFLILSELEMIGVHCDLPGEMLESLNSRQFAEAVAGMIRRKINFNKLNKDNWKNYY
jgi:hypothetical protein